MAAVTQFASQNISIEGTGSEFAVLKFWDGQNSGAF